MSKYEFATNKIMAPGPVPMPSYVKDSMRDLECHHRTAEFAEVFTRVLANLKTVFQTEQHCYTLPCTGTGALEAAVINTMNPGDGLLAINAGKFGERWGKIASAFGLPCHEIGVPWGDDIDLNLVESHLHTGKYKALGFQASETSSGALLPTKELAALCKKYDVLSLVDGITALGAVDLPMDQLGIDVFVGGSQKAFMLPTGMAFLAMSEKAENMESAIPKFYFDLAAEKKTNATGKSRWSTQTQLIIGLDMVLEEILKGGLSHHFAEIQKRAETFRAAVNLPLFPKSPSPSLSCLEVPEGVKAAEVIASVKAKGFVIVGGQEHLKGKVIRVGHMGAMTLDDLNQTAAAINQAIG